MSLYHFTARRFVPAIMRDGLTLGSIPLSIAPPRLLYGYQWLTLNPDASAQEWAEGTGRLPYSRTEARLKIKIPKPHRFLLMPWSDVRHLTPLADGLSAFGDPWNWLVFKGRIPPAWIRDVSRAGRGTGEGA